VIYSEVQKRVEENREALPPSFSVEQMLDAAVMASQVRDEVDAAVDELQK
jgi:hypothetical protein